MLFYLYLTELCFRSFKHTYFFIRRVTHQRRLGIIQLNFLGCLALYLCIILYRALREIIFNMFQLDVINWLSKLLWTIFHRRWLLFIWASFKSTNYIGALFSEELLCPLIGWNVLPPRVSLEFVNLANLDARNGWSRLNQVNLTGPWGQPWWSEFESLGDFDREPI